MANKIKKKIKKGLKNILLPKKHKAKGQNDKPKPLSSEIVVKPTLWQKKVEVTSKVENIKKDKKGFKWAKKSFKTKNVEKDSKKEIMFKKGFKKLKGKIKSLNPIKSKKNKIIGSKKLAFLLTAGTIVAILPMFNLAPFPALAITSACVFSINFVAVKTLKKFIKQRKLAAEFQEAEAEAKEESTVAELGKMEDVAIEPAKRDYEQISRE